MKNNTIGLFNRARTLVRQEQKATIPFLAKKLKIKKALAKTVFSMLEAYKVIEVVKTKVDDKVIKKVIIK